MYILFSPAKPRAEQSSSEDLLGSDAMGSGTLLEASFSKRRTETEVSSQKDPGHGGEEKVAKVASGGHTLGAGHTGEKALVGVDGGGHLKSGPKPDMIRDPYGPRVRQAASANCRRYAFSTGRLRPTRGAGYFIGGAEGCLHR